MYVWRQGQNSMIKLTNLTCDELHTQVALDDSLDLQSKDPLLGSGACGTASHSILTTVNSDPVDRA